MPNFVVQDHIARTHHFDFRLEKDGVYKSWPVPKCLPVESGLKRLAVKVEDHALESRHLRSRASSCRIRVA